MRTKIIYNFAYNCYFTQQISQTKNIRNALPNYIAPKLAHHRSLATYHRMGKKKKSPPVAEENYHLPAHSSLSNGKGKIDRFLAVYNRETDLMKLMQRQSLLLIHIHTLFRHLRPINASFQKENTKRITISLKDSTKHQVTRK